MPWGRVLTDDAGRFVRQLWDCEVCGQSVERDGPWCDLYCVEQSALCRPLAIKWLREADAAGDGPMVNALCEVGRRQWGPSLWW